MDEQAACKAQPSALLPFQRGNWTGENLWECRGGFLYLLLYDIVHSS